MSAGLALFLPPLHFLLMTQQPAPGVAFCHAVRSSGQVSLGLRVRWCRRLSQRQALRSARWWPRSCPGPGLVHCSRQTWLRSPFLQEAVGGSGRGDSGRAGSGHRGGGAAPSPYADRKSRSIVRCCSRCTSHWLCGHSSSSSARHRHQLFAWISWSRLVITCHLLCRTGGALYGESVALERHIPASTVPCFPSCLSKTGKLPTPPPGQQDEGDVKTHAQHQHGQAESHLPWKQ